MYAIVHAGVRALADPTPGPTPTTSVNPALVTPGPIGFVGFVVIIVAVILLVSDMMRRIRRARVRLDIQEELNRQVEDSADADGDGSKSAPDSDVMRRRESDQ